MDMELTFSQMKNLTIGALTVTETPESLVNGAQISVSLDGRITLVLPCHSPNLIKAISPHL